MSFKVLEYHQSNFGAHRVSSVQLSPVAALGRQFSSVVGTIETAEFNSSQSQKQFQGSTNLSYFSTITELEVYNLLSKLNANKASGWDEVEAKYLKISAAAIELPLLPLLRHSSIPRWLLVNFLKIGNAPKLLPSLNRVPEVIQRTIGLFLFCQLSPNF